MRLLIFSDIHGNSDALDALFDKMQDLEFDKIIFCGDIFGYYYNQKKIIEKLLTLKNLVWVNGNHDEYFLKLYRGDIDAQYYIENYGHSYDHIHSVYDDDDANIIASHSSQAVLDVGKCKIGIFHGTPDNQLEGRLYPNTAINNHKIYQKFDIVILGHTHCRMVRLDGSTLIINPGSLGQPRDGSGYGYCILDTNYMSVIFGNVQFDQTRLYGQIDQYDPELKKLKYVLERG